jgi:hypothetical protein
MKDLQEPFGSALEWEGLQSAKKVTGLKHSGELLSGSATATIERSDMPAVVSDTSVLRRPVFSM